MSELLSLGISHKTAPVALRERLALTESELQRFTRRATQNEQIHEAVAISTCNRTELYLVVGEPVEAESALLGMFSHHAGIRPTELAEVIYSPRNCDAARQLFRVTAGLESMIVGEHEVQGQVKRAYEAALAAGTTGPMTNRLFGAALQTGRRARSETRIAESHVSVSTVAVGMATASLGDLSGRHVVIIGAGETSELTARALHSAGVRTIFVANRHADRARSLAERFGGQVISLDGLPEQLEWADIVLASTSSPHPIVGVDELAEVMRARRGRPLMLIDLAVPRDIDAACGDLEGVTLRDIDDLQAQVAGNMELRAGEIPLAEGIVEQEIARFASWMGQLDVLPAIADLRAHADALVEGLLAENAGRWETASPRDIARIEALARSVAGRLLHEPTIRPKSLDAERSHGSVKLVRELFGLSSGDEAAAPASQAGGEVRPLRRREGA
ncbi:MAG: glutamyl-tRNA reductase [Solirubrobacteraceae bacterium]